MEDSDFSVLGQLWYKDARITQIVLAIGNLLKTIKPESYNKFKIDTLTYFES